MKTYFLNLESKPVINGSGRFVAASKATTDIKTLMQFMPNIIYKPIIRHTNHKLFGVLEIMVGLFSHFMFIPKKSCLFVQYPIVNINAYYPFRGFFRKRNTIAIVHDLQSYRYPHFKHLRAKELSILNSMSCLIVHSEAMKEQLKADGIGTPMIVLGIFDYLLDSKQHIHETKDIVVFAGALDKSLFLRDFHKLDFGKLSLYMYGAFQPDVVYSKNLVYKGRFLPDNITSIEGEWGLMWDGDSIECSGGNFGEYLTLIAPHKLSLYIACGLKIIVWEGSAMANLIISKGLGITIKSLKEIPRKISSLNKDNLMKMEQNVLAFGKELREGKMFIQAFKSAINTVNTEKE